MTVRVETTVTEKCADGAVEVVEDVKTKTTVEKEDGPVERKTHCRRRLHYDDPEMALWMKQDGLIRNGYRPQLHTYEACASSLFWLHNESVNIWVHLLPAIVYSVYLLSSDYSAFNFTDAFIIRLYIAGTAGSLYLSASLYWH